MAWKKYKLGELIELCDERNTEGKYTIEDVKGVSNTKEIMSTKADMNGRSLDTFRIVSHYDFVFNRRTTRMGEKIGLGFNDNEKPFIVTEDYVVFRDKELDKLYPKYLFMLFNRHEFDRYVRWDSWGSATEFFNWENMCDVDVVLPSLDVQKQYAAVYQAACDNMNAYQSRLDSLKTVCDGYIDKIKHTAKRMKLAEFSKECDKRNTDGLITSVNGVNKDKLFMPTVAAGEDLTKYKVVSKNQFACNLMHIGRDVVIPIALSSNECPFIVSPAYIVFSVNENIVLPDFAQLWLSRDEVGREAWFKCDSSVRSGMEKKRFFELEIPIPSINIQQDIVNIYQCYIERQRIAAQMKEQIKALCPVLIRGSLQE